MIRYNLSTILIATLLSACSTSGPGLFKKRTPHEIYSKKIVDAGLNTTALGAAWFSEAEKSLSQPLIIEVPYKERGYFEAGRPSAVGLRFSAKRGQKITIRLDKKPVFDFDVYLDLWETPIDSTDEIEFLKAADTTLSPLEYEVRKDATFQVRIQPELLKGGEYTLEISSGPSLAYPIKANGTNHIKSFWGADRDGGSRRHEGIDLFAPRHTPVVAAADGVVTRVNMNNLGGKVVWMRPKSGDFVLYYAHLDSQLVTEGQSVKTGDTLGLMGNTGNARTTAPHLHFGIYTGGGAIDPLPFINPVIKPAPEINASLNRLGNFVRSKSNSRLFQSPDIGDPASADVESNTLLRIEAATENWYKVELPNGLKGFINGSYVIELDKPIRKMLAKESQAVWNFPDTAAPKKVVLAKGQELSVLANYEGYYFVRNNDDLEGWIER